MKYDPQIASRVAKRHLEAKNALISGPIYQKLSRTFRAKGMEFFDFYFTLQRVFETWQDEPLEIDLVQEFTKAARSFIRTRTAPLNRGPKSIPSPDVVNQIQYAIKSYVRHSLMVLERNIRRLQTDKTVGASANLLRRLWTRIIERLVPLYQLAAKDRGIYMQESLKTMNGVRWGILRKMSKKNVQIEILKDTEPDTYDWLVKKKATYKEIDIATEAFLEGADLEAKGKRRLEYIVNKRITKRLPDGTQERFVRPEKHHSPLVHLGADPISGERYVATAEQKIVPIQTYLDERIQKEEGRQRVEGRKRRVNPQKVRDAARSMSNAEVDALPGDVSYEMISDDPSNNMRLARIFPVKWTSPDPVTGIRQRVVVDGRYKGILYDDLVSMAGKMMDNTLFGFDPTTRRPTYQNPKTQALWTEDPHITKVTIEQPLDEKGKQMQKVDKLMLVLPGKDVEPWLGLREVFRKMAASIPSIDRAPAPPGVSSRAHTVRVLFDPKDFALIRQNVQSASLSKGAVRFVEDHFDKQAKIDRAIAEESLEFYSAKELGGFKPEIGGKPLELRIKQKQAIAWLDAKDNKGVCALDTGVGKCVRGDTKILTNRGLVEIQEINPGITEPDTSVPVSGWEVVVGQESLPVKSFYYGGEKDTIQIETRYGYGVEGSLVHPLLVRTAGSENVWAKTPDLEEGDYLCIDRNAGLGSFPMGDVRLTVPVGDVEPNSLSYSVPDRMNPDLARFLGYLVAEGCTNDSNGFKISQCPEKNPEVRADIEQLLQSQLGWSKDTYNGKMDIKVSSTFLVRYLESAGIVRGVSRDKVIPPTVLRGTRETVAAFLRGYVEAEGSVGKQGIEISTASRQLAEELQVVLLRFGIVANRSPKYVRGYDHTYWRVAILGEGAEQYHQQIGFVSQRKQDALGKFAALARNPNHDIVPYMAPQVQGLHREIFSRFEGSTARFREQFGSSIHNTMNHVRFGRRNPTYRALKEMLHTAAELGCRETDAFRAIAQIIELRYFYDPIQTKNPGRAVVMDIEVDDPRHCFIGNGIVNHNTTVALGSMQKMVRDGFLEDKATNGRFLFVSPKALRGNIFKEIDQMLLPEVAANLTERVDSLSYQEFSSASRSKKAPKSIKATWGDTPWSAKKYIAVYFDEAQQLKKFSSGPGLAAMTLNHPRKICLTASPMEREPMEAYILSAICNNINVGERRRGKYTAKAKAARKEMFGFRDQYCEAVGGRVVGMKDDPLTQRDLHTWVKTNIFYADKTDVQEYRLDKPNRRAEQVTMPDDLEKVYRRVSDQFAGLLRGLVTKFRELKINKNLKIDPDDLERIFDPRQKLYPVIQFMNALSNRPKEALELLAYWMEVGDLNTAKPSCPKVLRPMVLAFRKSTVVSSKKLRETASNYLENPKVAKAAGWISNKLMTSEANRAVLFTDDAAMVEISARELSEKIPGLHAACLASKIKVFSAGMELPSFSYPIPMQIARELAPNTKAKKRLMTEFAANEIAQRQNAKAESPEESIPVPALPSQAHKLPFKQKTFRWQGERMGYRMYTQLAPDPAMNKAFAVTAWQTFVLNEIIQREKRFVSCTMHGQTYQLGQNLQKGFNNVVHLDRDTWNSEDMKQRTARVWRSGQENKVDVLNVDMTYKEVRDPLDDTLDKIQEDFQKLSGALFDQIIKRAQSVPLGEEWFEMQQRNSAFMKTDEATLELMASPYLTTPQPSATK